MKRVAHIADVHIQDRRREEYAAVFGGLYQSLREEKVDIIALTGDIYDSKTRASANNYTDVSAFLAELSKIAPVVLIAGNHDTNVNTPGSPDLLTPVVRESKNPRVTLWRHSGVYRAHGVEWTVIAADSGITGRDGSIRAAAVKAMLARGEEPPGEEGESAGEPKVCLFHETIDAAEVHGIKIGSGSRLRAADFDPFDAALGGDIHARQGGPRWAYSGSLIQQNIGEPHNGHGYLLWELAPSEAPPYRTEIPKKRYVDIPSPRGFLRIELREGKDVTDEPRPRSPYYYEIAHDAATSEPQVAAAVAAARKLYGFAPRAVRSASHFGEVVAETKADLGEAQSAARSLAAHEEIIREMLAEETDEVIEAVIELHGRRFGEIAVKQRARVRLIRLEFSNLFCYGADNVVDFTQYERSLSGTVARNASGKSSLIDIILFALYDETPRGTKQSMINNRAKGYHLSLEFELDGKRGVIVKRGSVAKNAALAHRLEYDGEDLTRGTKLETCAELRRLVGDWEDALLTSVALQETVASADFVRMKPVERKKALVRLLALGAFEKIEKEMKLELTKARAELKALGGAPAGDDAPPSGDDAPPSGDDAPRGDIAPPISSERGKTRDELAQRVGELRARANALAEAIGEAGESADESAGEAAAKKAVELGSLLRIRQDALAVASCKVINERGDSLQAELVEPSGRRPWVHAAPGRRPTPAETVEAVKALLRSSAEIKSSSGPLTAAQMRETARDYERKAVEHEALLKALEGETNPDAIAELEAEEKADAARASKKSALKKKKAEHERIMEKKTQEFNSTGFAAEIRNKTEDELKELCKHPADEKALSELKKSMEAERGRVAALDALKESPLCSQCRTSIAATLGQPFSLSEGEILEKISEAALVIAAKLRMEQLALREKAKSFDAALDRVRGSESRLERLAEGRKQQAKIADRQRWAAEAQGAAQKWHRLASMASVLERASHYWEIDTKAWAAGKRLREAQKAADALNAEVEQLSAEHAQALATRDAAEKAKQLREIREELKDVEDRHRSSVETSYAAGVRRGIREAQMSAEKKRQAAVAEINRRIALYTTYREVLAGIGERLLGRARGTIEERINASLADVSGWQLLADDASSGGAPLRVRLTEKYELEGGSGALLPVQQCSGYQRFAIGMASRSALKALAEVPLPDCWIMDEGFGCLDEGNLEAVVSHLKAAAARETLTFVVTHLEPLKNRLEKMLHIEADDGVSRVRNTAETKKALAGAAAEKKAVAGATAETKKVAPAKKPPPTEQIIVAVAGGNKLCKLCNITVASKGMARHEASQKHQAKLAKKIGS